MATSTAIGVAHQAFQSDKRAVEAYHAGIMQSMDAARNAQIDAAKGIALTLAVTTRPSAKAKSDEALVPLFQVRAGFDALAERLSIVQKRRDGWHAIYRTALRNIENGEEALRLADDLVVRSSANAEQLRAKLTELMSQLAKE